MGKMIYVRKMDGTSEPYNSRKLERSLKKAGASGGVIAEILQKVEGILYDGIETKKLFSFVFSELRKLEKGSASKYNLKNSLVDLRISGGYVFEKFMGRIFEKKGYKTELNKLVRGKYVTHEIDIKAMKGKEVLMVEVKHHSKPWMGSRVDTALYVYARFLDVKDKFTKSFLATNTRFTSQVLKYANGVGMGLMGWSYPKGDSLQENIEKYKIYPITILDLPKAKLDKYLGKGLLTLEDLRKVEPELVKSKIGESL